MTIDERLEVLTQSVELMASLVRPDLFNCLLCIALGLYSQLSDYLYYLDRYKLEGK